VAKKSTRKPFVVIAKAMVKSSSSSPPEHLSTRCNVTNRTVSALTARQALKLRFASVIHADGERKSRLTHPMRTPDNPTMHAVAESLKAGSRPT